MTNIQARFLYTLRISLMNKFFLLFLALVSACYANLNISEGLIVHYEFEGNGHDASGNGNHSSPSGSFSYTDGHSDSSAIRINGDNSLYYSGGGYVELPSFPTSLNDGFTVSMWAKDEVLGGYPTNEEAYVSFGVLSDNGWISVDLNTAPASVIFKFQDAPINSADQRITYPIANMGNFTGEWKHIAFVYEPGRFEAYINGTSVGQLNITHNPFPVTEAAIGRHWWETGSSARMSATIDDFRVYDRALIDSEINELHQIESATHLHADHFNDGSINSALWETQTPFSDSYVREQNGYLEVEDMGRIVSKFETPEAYELSTRILMSNNSKNRAYIVLRTDGIHESTWVHGVGFHCGVSTDWDGEVRQLVLATLDAPAEQSAEVNATVPIQLDTWYDVKLVDTGSRVLLYWDGATEPTLELETTYSAGNKISFYNREGSGGGSTISNDGIARLDFIEVSYRQLSYAPASKDGDYVSEFREYLDGTNPETDTSFDALSQDLLYHFSGDKGVPELSGYFHDLSLAGNGVFTEDRFENIYSAFTVKTFDDYMEGTAPDLVGKSFTVSFWVKKLYESGEGGWLFGIGTQSSNGKVLHMGIDYGGTIRFSFFYNDLDATTPLEPFVWHHVTASYDVNNNERKVYLNGSLVASDFSGNTFTGDTYFRIGNPNLEVDDFRVYGRVLSEAQITDLGNISNPDSDGDRLTDYYEEVGKANGLRIISWIDGRTNIEITPSGIRYYHIQAAAPGIPTVLDLATVVNNDFWIPTWPGSGSRIDLNDYSSTYTFAESKDFIKTGGYSFAKTGRSSITVAQEPSAENGNTLILAADDIGVPGAAWHIIHVIPAGDSVLSSSNKDSDGDGVNDGTETVFGGNPFRATEKPPFQAWATGGEMLTLSFPTENGVTYDLESKLTLSVLESWSPLQSAIEGDGEPFEVTVPYSQSNEFFRFVEVVE